MDDSISKHTSSNLAARRRASLKYAANNKERISERMRSYRKLNPEKYILVSAKQRARKRGIPFNLDIEDIQIPEVCPVFGFSLEMADFSVQKNSPSLDRINPELGYVKGNVQVISSLANAMKSDATNKQLLQFADWIKTTYE